MRELLMVGAGQWTRELLMAGAGQWARELLMAGAGLRRSFFVPSDLRNVGERNGGFNE